MEKTVWDKNWDDLYSNVLRNTSLNNFGERAYKCIAKWGIEDDSKILEAGSGTGRLCIALAKDFPSSAVYGIDISKYSVNLAKMGAKQRNIENVKFVQGDIFKLPFPDNYFDLVFNEGVIEHFYNYEESIKEMVRVTKPSGKIIIAVPNWYCFPHTIYKKIVGDEYEYGYEKSFKHKELVKAVKELKLKDIEMAGFYPAHGVKRLAKYSMMFTITGKYLDVIFIKLDSFTKGIFSKYFGFEIVIKCIKK